MEKTKSGPALAPTNKTTPTTAIDSSIGGTTVTAMTTDSEIKSDDYIISDVTSSDITNDNSENTHASPHDPHQHKKNLLIKGKVWMQQAGQVVVNESKLVSKNLTSFIPRHRSHDGARRKMKNKGNNNDGQVQDNDDDEEDDNSNDNAIVGDPDVSGRDYESKPSIPRREMAIHERGIQHDSPQVPNRQRPTKRSVASDHGTESFLSVDGDPDTNHDSEKDTVVRRKTRLNESATSLPPSADWWRHLLEEYTVGLLCLGCMAGVPTYYQWSVITQNQIPVQVAGCWIVVAYASGYMWALYRWKKFMMISGDDIRGDREDDTTSSSLDETECDGHEDRNRTTAPARNRPSILERVTQTLYPSTIRSPFRTEKAEAKKSVHNRVKNRSVLTHLNAAAGRFKPWQRGCDPLRDSTNQNLMKQLLKMNVGKIRKRGIQSNQGITTTTAQEASVPPVIAETTSSSSAIGSFELSTADSLDDFVVAPVFTLRGMDVFLTDLDPESDAANHPFLIKHGLRNVPSFIVNILTQWGNIFIYFEMPTWIKDWNELSETEDDTDAVKALKRFLNGDDKYRNERLKMIPSVVDGPMAVRLIAPPKKELQVQGTSLPVTWKKHPSTNSDGRKLYPSLECELDCLSSRAIRTMAGIVKNNLKLLKIDVAVVISKPYGQKEDEPIACLGLWRFDHIDVSGCPKLPDRWSLEAKKQGQSSDFIRASRIMQVPMIDLE